MKERNPINICRSSCLAQKERLSVPQKPRTPCKMEEISQIPQIPLIIDVDIGETSKVVEGSPFKMVVEKIKKTYIANQKPLDGLSYYRHSYKKIKQANTKLIRRNQKLKYELAQLKQKLKLYECKDGLSTLLKAVEETRKFDDNNSKGKKAQEVDKMKQKDVAFVTVVSKEDFPLQAKMMGWQEKVQELGT